MFQILYPIIAINSPIHNFPISAPRRIRINNNKSAKWAANIGKYVKNAERDKRRRKISEPGALERAPSDAIISMPRKLATNSRAVSQVLFAATPTAMPNAPATPTLAHREVKCSNAALEHFVGAERPIETVHAINFCSSSFRAHFPLQFFFVFFIGVLGIGPLHCEIFNNNNNNNVRLDHDAYAECQNEFSGSGYPLKYSRRTRVFGLCGG